MWYLDHAATSFPKDPRVVRAVCEAIEQHTSPGRGSSRAVQELGVLIQQARERCARLLGAPEGGHVAFTLNATDALNMALKGVLKPGDEVVTTEVEHNSVTRPLRGLQQRHCVRVHQARADATSRVDPEEILRLVGPRTRLVVLAHASNVTGAHQPVAEVGAALRARHPDTLLLVDAAQTAGYRVLDEVSRVADLVAVAGHKGAGGPLGIGFLWIAAGCRVSPWREGGTGTHSDAWFHPQDLPKALEAGTPNVPGILGLSEAVRIRLEEQGLSTIQDQRSLATAQVVTALHDRPGVQLFGPLSDREPVFPLRVEGHSVDEAAVILEQVAGIRQRGGLHCAPGVHRVLGTFPEGTLRVSLGAHPAAEEVQAFLDGVDQLRAE